MQCFIEASDAGIVSRITKQSAAKTGHGQAKARLKRVKPADSYGPLIAAPLRAKLTIRSDKA
jgi:hypothetical protein